MKAGVFVKTLNAPDRALPYIDNDSQLLINRQRGFRVFGRYQPVKMAVPAQVLRLRGAEAASELARAGTIEVRAWDVVSCDQTGVWATSPS